MDGATGSRRLLERNVQVYDIDENILAGFWQYGTVTWSAFYNYLNVFIQFDPALKIFDYRPDREAERGTPRSPNDDIVAPGYYIILPKEGEATKVGLKRVAPRSRFPTRSNTVLRGTNHYRERARIRDGMCLISGLKTTSYSRLKAVHIFPRSHEDEWTRKGYPSKITDPHDIIDLGGRTKIDSMQNIITLRTDLRDAWDNHEFGANPDDNYRITAFTNGNKDVNGLYLRLDHIQDPNERPLDELLVDHFQQCIIKHVKGAAEHPSSYVQIDDAFDNGSLDLSRVNFWGSGEGKRVFELAIADRLFEHQVIQDDHEVVREIESSLP